MKYSLTRLLLEDTAAQQVNFDVLPSAEDAEGVAIINTYAWFTKSLKKIKELAGGGMELLYRYADPEVKSIIDDARELARKKDEEMRALLSDTLLCDMIWSKFDPSGSASPDEKKKMATCLGYFADAIGTLKIAPAPGQSDDNFKAELMQGCEEIKTAAAIAMISDLEIMISEANADLAKAVKKSTLTKIRSELGEGGESFSIDLAEDSEIRPILEAHKDAEREFRKALRGTGKSLIFQNNSTLSFNVSRAPGTGRYATICDRRRGSVTEVRLPIPLTAILLEGRHPLYELTDTSADAVEVGDVEDEEEETGASVEEEEQPALQPDPDSLEDALNQIMQRYGRARRIVDVLRLHDDLTMDDILLAVKPNPMRALRFRFPKDDGSLGGPSQIATQGSISAERAGAGIIISFLMGARSRAVQPSVLRMISALVDDRVTFDDEGKIRNKPDPIRVLSSLGDEVRGLEKNNEARLALIYAICAVDEFASSKTPEELGNLRDVSISQYGENWKENLVSFYYMMQQDPELAQKTKIRIRPGAKVDPWYKKIIKAARSPGTARERLELLRSELGEKTITTMRPYPSIVRDDTTISMPQIKGARKSGQRAKSAVDAAKFLIKGVSGLTKRVMQSRTELGEGNRTPSRVGGANLNVMSMCDAFAMHINRSRRNGVGKLLMDMGYTSENALLLRPEPATGRDVWDALVDLTGAKTADAPFNILNYSRWESAMTGDNAARAIAAFRILVLRETANTVARAVLHAVSTMAERGVLPTGKQSIAQQLTRDLSVQYSSIVASVEAQRVLIAGSETTEYVTKVGLRPTQYQTSKVAAKQDAIPGDLVEVSRDLAGEGFYVTKIIASEDAPREVSIESLAVDEPAESGPAEGEAGGSAASPPPGETPPTTPPAGGAPGGSAPGAAPPAAEPEPEPSGPERIISIEDGIVPGSSDEAADVNITVTVEHEGGRFDIEMTGSIGGGASQKSAADSDPDSVSVDDAMVSGRPVSGTPRASAHAAADSLTGDSFTLGELCDAIEEALSTSGVKVKKISVDVS